MTDSHPAFPPEEISSLAQANANLFLFSTLAFLKEQGIPIHEWTSFLQIRLAPRWATRRAFTAGEIARLIAKNLVSGGATSEHLPENDDDTEAVAVLRWDALQDTINAFPPLTPTDFLPMLDFYGALVKGNGYQYQAV